MENFDILIRPIISEKSTTSAETFNQYVFAVNRAAKKQEIAHAINKLFKVTPLSVRTITMHGKVKRRGNKFFKRPNWKKAIITLAAGQKIDFFQSKQST